jgi:hypothetical protein
VAPCQASHGPAALQVLLLLLLGLLVAAVPSVLLLLLLLLLPARLAVQQAAGWLKARKAANGI